MTATNTLTVARALRAPAATAAPATAAPVGDAPTATAAPTVLLLHGYGSDERDLAGLAAYLPGRVAWASLRAPLDLATGGAAWFPITTPGRPDPEAVASATEAIWRWVDATLGATSAIVPLGFSQGGAMATELLRSRPGRVPAAVVLGGFVLPEAKPGDTALAAARPPVSWGRGADDSVIAADAVARTAAWLPAHTAAKVRTYPGLAHGIDAAEIGDVRAFLERAVPAAE